MLDIDPHVAARKIQPERLILVCLIGSNQTLADACRGNLDHLCAGEYHLQECGSSEASSGYDIYIWDFESSPPVPSAMVTGSEATKVVIVKKGSLATVRRELPDNGFTYLLGPATPLALRSVLESAVARLQLPRPEDVTSSRLKHDGDRIQKPLLQTNPKLCEHGQDRTNFLTRAVHDIRVPLMAVQGYCGLLLAGQVGSIDPEQARILEKMQRSLTRLCGLVESTMDLGTSSQVAKKLKLENASIEACVQQAVYEILPFVERKQISLNVDVQAPDGVLHFDAGKLEQVLVNLLDNACKFTPKGGAIVIRGLSIGAQELGRVGLPESIAGYCISIRDNGRGIDADHIEQIFDEHTSFGDAMDRSGSGLGLAICRMIVEAHNGRIWADSGTQGSSFSFVLPLVRSFNDFHLSDIAV
jgi:signal transduction histidine kinase